MGTHESWSGMRRFRPEAPLYFSHIPKCAGSSVLSVLQHWFDPDFHTLQRYLRRPDVSDCLPELQARQWAGLVAGHFNRARGFGLEGFRPQDKQIITFVRDPWDRVLSGYFFRKHRVHKNPRFKPVAEMDVDAYLAGWPYDDPVMGPPMSNFLPPISDTSEVADVLDASCIAVGVVDQFETSMRIFARVLNQPLPDTWGDKKNTAPRELEVSDDLRDAFRERNPLEYAIYDWASERVQQMAPAVREE